ncbi:MAG: hypothetical protein BMS9Abin29_0796 [Gemmatimonadota bacterium]|nr:MAG: hypothetical protein BMS9Abin29_0796 [Gemmatimonadota bacterium]
MLRTEDNAYSIESRVQAGLLRARKSILSHRNEAPDEANELLAAARSRIARIEEENGGGSSAAQAYKLEVLRELEEKLGD